MKLIRKTYDWVLSWAESKYGSIALFVLAFAESSFFPIPPDVLLIALVLGMQTKAFRFALICTIGSVIGGMFGYYIGYALWSNVDLFFYTHIPSFTPELFDSVVQKYNEWGFWIVFTAGFTPIPYKVFTIASGVTEMNIVMFTIASVISRAGRFFLVAWLLWKYGAPIKGFIDKYFNWLALGFTILLIGGFVLIKYMM